MDISVVSITWKKIAALLGFCYSLCRQFLLSTDESTDNQRSLQRSLGAFFTAVVGFLARFLFEGRLLNWIHSRGGWVSEYIRAVQLIQLEPFTNFLFSWYIGECSPRAYFTCKLDTTSNSWGWNNCCCWFSTGI